MESLLARRFSFSLRGRRIKGREGSLARAKRESVRKDKLYAAQRWVQNHFVARPFTSYVSFAGFERWSG